MLKANQKKCSLGVFFLCATVGFQCHLFAMNDDLSQCYSQVEFKNDASVLFWLADLKKQAQKGQFEADNTCVSGFQYALDSGNKPMQQEWFEIVQILYKDREYDSEENRKFSDLLLNGLQEYGVPQIQRQVECYRVEQELLFMKSEVKLGTFELTDTRKSALEFAIGSGNDCLQQECFEIAQMLHELPVYTTKEIDEFACVLLTGLQTEGCPSIQVQATHYLMLQAILSIKSEVQAGTFAENDEESEKHRQALEWALESGDVRLQQGWFEIAQLLYENKKNSEIGELILRRLQDCGCETVQDQVRRYKVLQSLRSIVSQVHFGTIDRSGDAWQALVDGSESSDVVVQCECCEAIKLLLEQNEVRQNQADVESLEQLLRVLHEQAGDGIKEQVEHYFEQRNDQHKQEEKQIEQFLKRIQRRLKITPGQGDDILSDENAYGLSLAVESNDSSIQDVCFDVLKKLGERYPARHDILWALLEKLQKRASPALLEKLQHYCLLQFLKFVKDGVLAQNLEVNEEIIENLAESSKSGDKDVQLECFCVLSMLLERLTLLEDEQGVQAKIQELRGILFGLLSALHEHGSSEVQEKIHQDFFEFHALSKADKISLLQSLKDQLQAGLFEFTEENFLKIQAFLDQATTSIDEQIQQGCLEVLVLLIEGPECQTDEPRKILEQLLHTLEEHAHEGVKNKIWELDPLKNKKYLM